MQRTIQTGIRTTGQFEARQNTINYLHRGIHLDQGYTGSCTVADNKFAACQYGLYVSRLTQANAQLGITCNSFLRSFLTSTPGTNYGIYVDATSAFTFIVPAGTPLAPVMMNRFDAVGQSGMYAIHSVTRPISYSTFNDYSFGTALLNSNVNRVYPGIYMAGSGYNCFPVYPSNGIPRPQGLTQAPSVALAAYPNPAGGSTLIRYELPPTAKRAVLCLRSLRDGREAGRFELAPQEREYKLVLAGYPAGLYAYSLLVDELPVATQRLEIR